jgi:HD superfamily phosphohydrolase
LQQKKKITHENIGKDLITKTEIGDLLSRSGFDKKFIAKLAFGESKFQFMNEMLSGSLSADLMDYLPRDGYFTGAEHAKIDHKRITQSLDVYKNKLALEKSALYSFESMMHSRYQMFKAVYFHKTVRAAEVMLLESIKLADSELGFTSLDLDDYVKLTDDYVVTQLINLTETSSDLKKARKIAQSYQNRDLFKCVYERIFTSKTNLGKVKTSQLREDLAKKSKVDGSEIFVDSSITPSIPLNPAKKESQFVILTTRDKNKLAAEQISISKIPLVSAMSGFMNILRIYTTKENRKKVEMAAKSTSLIPK